MPPAFSDDDINNSVSCVFVISKLSQRKVPFPDDLPKPKPARVAARHEDADPGYNDPSPTSDEEEPPPVYEKTAALDILDKRLNSEDGQSDLQAEIQKLGDSAAAVEGCFKNVARGLEKTLKVTMTESQEADIRKFKKTWDGYHKTYVNLLWESRRVAGKARTIATDFAGDFLCEIKEEKCSVAEKKKRVVAYREELEHGRQNSQKLSQGFLDLQSAVVTFQADLRQYAARTDKLREDVEVLIEEIQKIKEQLTKLTNATLESAVTTLGFQAAAGGALAVGLICPPLWVGAAYGAWKTYKNGRQCLNKYKEQQAVSKDLGEKKLILADHQRSLKGLEKISTFIVTLDDDIDFIQAKLCIFAQIWTFVHADLTEVEMTLDLASSQAEFHSYFRKKIEAVSTIYKSLARALYWYETSIHIETLHNPAQSN